MFFDVVALREVLRNPEISGFETRLLLDAGMDEARTAVAQHFQNREPDDLLLFYYTGHGLRGDDGELYLSLPQTDSRTPSAISLEANYVRAQIDRSRSQRKVVILDCCHSGAFVPDSDDETAKRASDQTLLFADDFVPKGRGSFVLAASSAKQSAFEKDGKSLFTQYLVEALETGQAAPETEDISVQDLYHYVSDRVASVTERMRPKLWPEGAIDPLYIARNLMPRPVVPPDLVQLLWEDNPHVSHSGAIRLVKLMEQADTQFSADIIAVLRQRLEQPEKLTYLTAQPILEVLEPAAASEEELEALQAEVAAEKRARAEADAALLRAEKEAAQELSSFRQQLEELKKSQAEAEARYRREQETKRDQLIAEHQAELKGQEESFTAEIERLKRQPAVQRSLVAFIGCVAGAAIVSSAFWLFPEPATINAAAPKTGDILEQDCDACPDMVMVEGGTFTMGSPATEEGRNGDEKQRQVTVENFAIARTEVTFDQWQACVDGGGCQSNPEPIDRGWGRGSRPVINVSWNDTQEYIAWLNTQVEGRPFRLPSEAEWEYAARARTTTPFSFGETISTDEANYDGNSTYASGSEGKYREKTVPVDELDTANAWGLKHMHGNVWEWVEDVYADYDEAPTDGSAHLPQPLPEGHSRVLRGGSWDFNPQYLRSANRNRVEPESRNVSIGFRPARTHLTP